MRADLSVAAGRVKLFHVRKDLLTDRGSIDAGRLLPVSRLGGISYGRTTQAWGEHWTGEMLKGCPLMAALQKFLDRNMRRRRSAKNSRMH